MHKSLLARVAAIEREQQAQLYGPVDKVIGAFVQCYPDEVWALSSAVKKNLAYGVKAHFTEEEVSAGVHLNQILNCLRYGLPLTEPEARSLTGWAADLDEDYDP